MNIKQLRQSKKITQKQLSNLCGLSQQHISKIENNLIAPNYLTLKKILRALGYDLVLCEGGNNDKQNK